MLVVINISLVYPSPKVEKSAVNIADCTHLLHTILNIIINAIKRVLLRNITTLLSGPYFTKMV